MNVRDLFPVAAPRDRPRSELPAGGSPADDRAYLQWLDRYAESINIYWTDIYVIRNNRLPRRDPLDAGRLSTHLFTAIGGCRTFDRWTYQHELRLIAIAYRDHRRRVVRQAELYAAGAVRRFLDDDGS